MLHEQIYVETSTKIELKTGPHLIESWLLRVHVCRFINQYIGLPNYITIECIAVNKM